MFAHFHHCPRFRLRKQERDDLSNTIYMLCRDRALQDTDSDSGSSATSDIVFTDVSDFSDEFY